MREGRWQVRLGVAAGFRNNLVQKSAARVRLDAKGVVTVETHMTDIGTGSYTIIAQTAAETMGVPLSSVVVFMAADLRVKREGQLVAPAFVGGSISSPANDAGGLGVAMKHNPDMHFGENTVLGYTLVEAGQKEMTFSMRSMLDARVAETDRKIPAQFVIENGKLGATRI